MLRAVWNLRRSCRWPTRNLSPETPSEFAVFLVACAWLLLDFGGLVFEVDFVGLGMRCGGGNVILFMGSLEHYQRREATQNEFYLTTPSSLSILYATFM